MRETFFKMFKDGLIFRGKRLVNWDTQLQTSVADDETYTEDTKGGFWTFKYPVNGLARRVHPLLARRAPRRCSATPPCACIRPTSATSTSIGKTVTIPLVDRDIPIIADGLLADPTLGTGCVKVTPAHDPNDYACWHAQPADRHHQHPEPRRHDQRERRQVRRASIATRPAKPWSQDMEELGLFEGKEDRVIPLKYSDRSKTPIEPYLSDQWFVKMGDPTTASRASRRWRWTP